ncbi:MAG: MBL fold metallo-hydrolase [Williamsia herbipolensis]|nr:MBL fold metallo-hydrolase [Williamsia herbipolensis]
MGRVTEVADDVFLAEGTDVNWVLLREGRDVTLIDAGYPGDRIAVAESIRAVGARPDDVRAVLLTHAHIDHMGAANELFAQYAVPLFVDPVEVSHAHRDHLEQAGPAAVVRNITRPGVLPWSLRVVRAGALKKVALLHAQPFPGTGPLDLPGRPVPVATHGHTSGHSAYFVPHAGVVVTGDALVTAHPVSTVDGPQILGPMFNHGTQDEALAAIGALEVLDAGVILPGHGPVARLPVAEAVARARGAAVRPGSP